MLKKDIDKERGVYSFLIAGIQCFTERLKGAVYFDQSSRGISPQWQRKHGDWCVFL